MDIPANVVAFMAEYESLCRKHGLMVSSDGEPVSIGPADSDLWGIKTSTADWLRKHPIN